MRIAQLASASGLVLAAALAVSTASAQPANPELPPGVAASPAPAPPPAPPSGKRPAMMTSGIVVGLIGAVLGFGGGIAYANAQRSSRNDDRFAGQLTGICMMGFGGAHLLVGVPLAIAGAIPRSTGKGSPAVLPAAIPSITAGPRSVVMRWAF